MGRRRSTHMPAGFKNYRKARNNAWKAKVEKLLMRDGMNCALCGEPLDFNVGPGKPMSVTIDHILPKTYGGGNRLENLQLAHQICNSTRGDIIITQEHISYGSPNQSAPLFHGGTPQERQDDLRVSSDPIAPPEGMAGDGGAVAERCAPDPDPSPVRRSANGAGAGASAK